MIFQGKLKNGKLILYDVNRFDNYLLSLGDREIEVIVKKPTSSRTVSQNKLYWKILEIISESTGHTKEELHALFGSLFLCNKIQVMGEPVNAIKSTTKLTTEEFGKYLNDIRFYMADVMPEIILPIE